MGQLDEKIYSEEEAIRNRLYSFLNSLEGAESYLDGSWEDPEFRLENNIPDDYEQYLPEGYDTEEFRLSLKELIAIEGCPHGFLESIYDEDYEG